MNRNFKNIYEKYKYLATTPAKIDTALVVIVFNLFFVLAGIDFCLNVAISLLSVGFVIINIAVAIGSVIYIANLRELPEFTNLGEREDFDFRMSLKMTRLLQKEVVESIESSKDNFHATNFRTKVNNSLRLLSFVVVFRRNAYLFIRQSNKVVNRSDHDALLAVANDIADNLGLSISVLLPLNISTSIGLGHYHFQHYEVMQLR